MTTTHSTDDSTDLDSGDSESTSRRPKPMTIAIVAAAVAFSAVVIITATRFIAGVDDIDDTPAQSVDGFLTALFNDRDAEAMNSWLCEEKQDRDFDEVVNGLSQQLNDSSSDVSFSTPQEVTRDVGSATVTTELEVDGEAATWTFTLVAEDSTPQWVVCGISE